MPDLSSNYPDLPEAIARMRDRAGDKDDSQKEMWRHLGAWLDAVESSMKQGKWPEAPSLPVSVASAFVRWDKIDQGIHFIDSWKAGVEPRPWRKAYCWCGWEVTAEGSPLQELRLEIDRLFALHLEEPVFVSTCSASAHRPPQGPNEDLGWCYTCNMPTFSMRPENETYGLHLDDCSLPVNHESYCEPGGNGHPPAETVRGFWPGMDEDIREA